VGELHGSFPVEQPMTREDFDKNLWYFKGELSRLDSSVAWIRDDVSEVKVRVRRATEFSPGESFLTLLHRLTSIFSLT
jgi:hypothetical protein